jgi:rifampicin phosphotransferase
VSSIRHLDELTDEGAALLGGKGWNLALLTRAGLPVPAGFCITAAAHREASRAAATSNADAAAVRGLSLAGPLGNEIVRAYERLGGGVVAVRSSATVEDGAAASFAGLQETLLGVEGQAALVAAVERVWQSIDSERARAYRAHGNVDENQVAMAVVVQRLVDAEVSGVLFTRDPTDSAGQRMLVEAAWGLGEAVVSGLVTPDRYHIDRQTGRVVEQHIAGKALQVTRQGRAAVAGELQLAACLDAAALVQLAELGRQVEAFYGEPRDLEWAWAGGRLWLLQARPITASGAAQREQVRCEEIVVLESLADPRGTVWARYNLAEVLPAPTPMTWAIVSRLMAGQGGLGRMFRDLGFDPDPIIDRLGFIDLVCGRPYVNLSREARLHFAGFPYAHKFDELKQHPERALYPQASPDPSQVTFRFFLRLPGYLFKMLRASRRIEAASATLAARLRTEVFPRFEAAARSALADDLDQLSGPALIARLDQWRRLTLDEFAKESLKSATLAATALATLQQRLTPTLGADAAATRCRELLTGIEPDPAADVAAALARLSRGELTPAEFLAGFGHRGSQEMELAEPRWSERPNLLPAAGAGSAPASSRLPAASRAALSAEHPAPAIVAGGGTDLLRSAAGAVQVERLRTYMALREAGKHYLMLGYAVIRQTLVELGRRHKFESGIFYLLPDELPRLAAGEDMAALAAERRRRRQIALGLEVPTVLFSDDLAAIGRPAAIDAAADLRGTPVSAGSCEGLALVLESPDLGTTTVRAADGSAVGDGFILVCPSTDPAWVPLFLRARGLIMETGGILSHGAIVAREFGLPAVVGVDHATRRIRTGQRVRVDGNTGAVHLFE